jgi:hypothetical protein
MRKLTSAILLLSIAAPIYSCPSVSVISNSEFSLMGIQIGLSEQSVIEKLGAPVKKNKLEGHQEFILEYKYMTIFLFDGHVDEMHVETSKGCTPAKICVGSALGRLREVYGKSTLKYRNGRDVVMYAVANTDCWFEFSISNEHVSSIDAKCPV